MKELPGGRGYRSPEDYTVAQWVLRTVLNNLRWARTQGVRQLVEEHELHPVHSATMAARKARWRRTHGRPAGEATAIFLVGVPRSGTNMMVRGLAESPEFEVHNEGDRSAFSRHRLRSDPVVRALVLRSRHRFVLFKPLAESHRTASLLDGLATPRPPLALWAYRDVDGRVRSALRKFGPAASRALLGIAAGTGGHLWQAQGLSEDSVALIRSINWATATPADGAALLWYVRNRLFFELGLDRRCDVLPVSYNALVRAPEPGMRAVCDFLGLEWDPRYAAHIDGRAAGSREAVALDPRIRARCDGLADQLDAAAASASARVRVT